MEQKGTLKYRKVQRTPQTGETQVRRSGMLLVTESRSGLLEGFVSRILLRPRARLTRGTVLTVLYGMHRPSAGADSRRQEACVSLTRGLFSIGMSSKAEDTKEKLVTAARRRGRTSYCT